MSEPDECGPMARTNYIRQCMFCADQMSQPLEFEGKIYKFCSQAHKNAWDYARKSVQNLSEKDWE